MAAIVLMLPCGLLPSEVAPLAPPTGSGKAAYLAHMCFPHTAARRRSVQRRSQGARLDLGRTRVLGVGGMFVMSQRGVGIRGAC